MNQDRIWQLEPDPGDLINQYASTLKISRVLAKLLLQRGITSLPEAQKFLWSSLDDLSSPQGMSGMEDAVKRIQRAQRTGEKIVVYGDYDVDGVCSVVILTSCLQAMGCKASYYIPDRFKEGYGLNPASINQLADKGCRLLISVDCGINSLDEVDRATQLNIDVIITDHHNPGVKLPRALAIINPKLDDCMDSRELCGAGVVYQLVRELGKDRLPGSVFAEWLALAALATVADVVPLQGDNRILVKEGLKIIRSECPPGIQALLEESGIESSGIDAWQLAFVLAPRINAAGRIENARLSAELLMNPAGEQARALARHLCHLNDKRKAIEESIIDEAAAMIAIEEDDEIPALVLASENWHHGVLGIAASRLCDRYRKPVLMIGWEEESGRGSARSLPGYNIFEALSECRESIMQFGGHNMAAGFRVSKDQYDIFKQSIIAWAGEIQKRDRDWGKRYVRIDVQIEPEEINQDLVRELHMLQPYGEGNPEPIFSIRSTSLKSPALMGKGKEHFKARLDYQEIECIAFNRSDFINFPHRQLLIDIAGHVKENEYRGRKTTQFRIMDAKAALRPDRYDPDAIDKRGALLREVAAHLAKKQAMVIVFPTLRLLRKVRSWLEGFFHSPLINELHGAVHPDDRQRLWKAANSGQATVLLSTRAFVSSYYRWKNEVLNIFDWPEVELSGLTWLEDQMVLTAGQQYLVYANRPSTIKSLQALYPELITEAGLEDSRARRRYHRQFFLQSTGVLLTDGGLIQGIYKDRTAQHIYFADAPFSMEEAHLVAEHWPARQIPVARIAFGRQGLESNQRFLDTLYPDQTLVQKVWRGIQTIDSSVFETDEVSIRKHVSKSAGIALKAMELQSIFRILQDMDLCRVQKKGSIMAIKLRKRDFMPDNLSKSAFFQEGQGEKKALAIFEQEIKKALDW